MKEVRKYLKRPIDLLFIDSKHSYEHVTRNISIYGAEFRPRFIILDDIELDAEMKRAWAEIAGQYAEHAFDASALARRLDTGFGVLDCRKVDKYHLIAAGDRIP
jgi:hypothetical protein